MMAKTISVVIGLSFMYLLLSLACSALNELVATLLGLRQGTLYRGIRRVLAESDSLLAAVYAHPLVQSIQHGMLPWIRRPSYMPNDIFAAVLHDVLPLVTPRDDAEKKQIEAVQRSISTLMAGTKLENAAQSEWKALGDWVSKERQVIGAWFDDAMARVSGSYKRMTQLVLLALALVVAVITNADSLTVFGALWNNSELRAAVTQQAGDYVAGALRKADDGSSNPQQFEEALKAANTKLSEAMNQLDALNLPIGWPAGFLELRDGETARSKVIGLFLTVLAVSLGAPFWFDVLSRFVNLRGSGNKPSADAKPAGSS